MPSSASSRLRFEIQALGENLNTWGDTRLNEALKRLEEGIAQVFVKAVTANYTLVAANYAADEARAAVLVLTGTPSATFKITIPGAQKTYFVANNTDADQTIGTAGGIAATVRTGQFTIVYCDATDTFSGDPTLDRIKPAAANVSLNNKKITALVAGTSPLEAVNYQQWLDLRAYATGIANSGVLAPGTVTNYFLRWNGTGWVEGAIPPLVAGSNTTTTGTFTAGTMAVNVTTGTGANVVVGRDANGRIPVAVSPWATKTGAYTAVNGDQLRVDSAAGTVTITTPAGAIADDQFTVVRDGINQVTVARNGGSGTIAGRSEDFIFDANNQLVTFICTGTTTWRTVPGQYV